jgi:hypothetical protein
MPPAEVGGGEPRDADKTPVGKRPPNRPLGNSRLAEAWQKENALGFEAWNSYVERHGVPLARYRTF